MNYFYDILPIELQDKIITIATKSYIKNIYTSWNVEYLYLETTHEEYRNIQSQNGKIWFFDSIIYKNECGGVCSLKASTNIFKNYENCIIIDEIRFIKDCKLFRLQHKFNKNINDFECDIYTGNYWKIGYKSPIDDHLNLANESYDDALDKSFLNREAMIL